jgi:hypothetical protein
VSSSTNSTPTGTMTPTIFSAGLILTAANLIAAKKDAMGAPMATLACSKRS